MRYVVSSAVIVSNVVRVTVYQFKFLPRDAAQSAVLLRQIVCPSLRLCVRSVVLVLLNIFWFLATRARLGLPHSAFQSTLNSFTVRGMIIYRLH